MMNLYDFTVRTHDGGQASLADYRGRPVLVVNTASECGFTPQYAGLEELNRRYGPKGLAILAFPCNQFGHQEPGSDAEIQTFCQTRYGVSFPVFGKLEVNGEGADPLYRYLTGLAEPGPIQWNFTKFLFDREGQFVARFEPPVTPETLTSDIERLLA